ncbi:MAG: hypothetical protein V1793_11780 [Pseudomonadota bacterium]
MSLTLFWACLMGKIFPVPLTLASTDEYRLKLLRVWEVLEDPYAVFDEPVYAAFKSFLVHQGNGGMASRVEKSVLYRTLS